MRLGERGCSLLQAPAHRHAETIVSLCYAAAAYVSVVAAAAASAFVATAAVSATCASLVLFELVGFTIQRYAR
jgi:hypothetical protein